MVDLIITDAARTDVAALTDFTLDAAWGSDENSLELSTTRSIPAGALAYMDGSEVGGIVDSLRDQLTRGGSKLTYQGRTWHGILAGKILAPDAGEDYLTVSGNAKDVLAQLLRRIGLDGLYEAEPSDVDIPGWQFDRYEDAYTGIRRMLAASGAKLRLVWASGGVHAIAEPAAHYGDTIDSDLLDFDATRVWRQVNHMIGLGKGDLKDRAVSHWFADSNGNVSRAQTLTGIDEIARTYDLSSADADELDVKTREKLASLQSQGIVDVTVRDDIDATLDVGDAIAARDNITGITVNATVTKKIVKVSDGIMTADYEAE